MYLIKTIPKNKLLDIKSKIIFLSKQYGFASILNSCGLESPYTKTEYEFRAALGINRELEISNLKDFSKLKAFIHQSKNSVFGGFCYEFKAIWGEQLKRNSSDFPLAFWVEPEILIDIKKRGNVYELWCNNALIFNEIEAISIKKIAKQKVMFSAQVTKKEYINTLKKIKKDIAAGDYYELNYCVPFKADVTLTNLENLFISLNKKSAAPFSAFIKYKKTYLVSASPERYMKNKEGFFTCQPIKGTSSRGTDKLIDNQLKKGLKNSEKEKAENVMIVDLMRNDLAKNCKTGTIKVAELFGIYSFSHVHQMISTIQGELANKNEWLKALLDTYPMGSMTGAPKKMVMKCIEKYEKTSRGIYSGSVGYFEPNGNFDLNVVIRSLVYKNGCLQYHVGGAITYNSDPEKEYEECLMKAKTLTHLFE